MAENDGAQDRRALLGRRIAAAKARSDARRRGDGLTIGAALGTLNEELDALSDEDHDEAQRELNKIEARLRAEEIRLEDDEEERDG